MSSHFICRLVCHPHLVADNVCRKLFLGPWEESSGIACKPTVGIFVLQYPRMYMGKVGSEWDATRHHTSVGMAKCRPHVTRRRGRPAWGPGALRDSLLCLL